MQFRYEELILSNEREGFFMSLCTDENIVMNIVVIILLEDSSEY